MCHGIDKNEQDANGCVCGGFLRYGLEHRAGVLGRTAQSAKAKHGRLPHGCVPWTVVFRGFFRPGHVFEGMNSYELTGS